MTLPDIKSRRTFNVWDSAGVAIYSLFCEKLIPPSGAASLVSGKVTGTVVEEFSFVSGRDLDLKPNFCFGNLFAFSDDIRSVSSFKDYM
jgi:hypothetical protein